MLLLLFCMCLCNSVSLRFMFQWFSTRNSSFVCWANANFIFSNFFSYPFRKKKKRQNKWKNKHSTAKMSCVFLKCVRFVFIALSCRQNWRKKLLLVLYAFKRILVFILFRFASAFWAHFISNIVSLSIILLLNSTQHTKQLKEWFNGAAAQNQILISIFALVVLLILRTWQFETNNQIVYKRKRKEKFEHFRKLDMLTHIIQSI